ncbi:MAG: hypothetical protein JOZ72_01610 [Alphaproteobacteria bacterium]|nr:hypothetical protein [Alphaproteobacteria bacterium]
MANPKHRSAAPFFGLLIASTAFVTGARAAMTISDGATANVACSAGVCSPTAKSAVLNVNDLAGMLASGDVTVASNAMAPDIEVEAALSWTSTSRLALDSYHSIEFKAPVVVAGTAALTITTDVGGSNGDFYFVKKGHVEFWDVTSLLTINGNKYHLFASMNTLRRAIRNSGGFGVYLAQAKTWRAPGKSFMASPFGEFEGTFEGLGNKITSLKINQPIGDQNHAIGLFASVGLPGVVRDVNLVDVQIAANGQVIGIGALAGGNIGTILNSRAGGQVTGGISQTYLGGLVGESAGTISNCSAEVTVSGPEQIAGAGGLVGLNQAVFPGYPGLIQSSFSTMPVSGGGSLGGLIGEDDGGTIQDSYSTGSVTTATGSSAGGLIGRYADADSQTPLPVLTTSYATGAVSGGGTTSVGGVLGQDLANTGISDVYWDLDTSGISDPAKGAGNATNDAGLTGLTDSALKSGLPPGFSKKVWKEKGSLNDGYPYLTGNAPD